MKRALTDEELLQLIESGLSDIEFLSDEDDDMEGWGDNSGDENGDDDQEMGPIEEDDPPEDVGEEIEDTEQEILEMVANEPTEELYDPMDGTSRQTEVTLAKKGRKRKPKSEKDIQVAQFRKENDLTEKKDIVWMKNVTYQSPNIKWRKENYANAAGELESPMHFFQKYFTKELFQLMVDNTNLYATQKQSKFLSTSIGEMMTFVGIHVVMGNCHFPRIKCYWAPQLNIPIVSQQMAINRFYKLRQHLHFVNIEEKPDNNDRLWKVRPLYDIIRARCLSLPLETDLCIDEQMIPFKGSLIIKQYIKNKPTKWGIKLLALCGQSGLCYDFIIYQGSTTELTPNHADVFGLAGALVTTLTERITEPNFRLYFDNYFSNYNVLQYLRNKFVYASCTARIDRFATPPFSSDKIMKEKGRGSSEEVVSKDGIIMVKWFDNKSVVMASSYKGLGTTDTCKRWDKFQKEYKQVSRPEVIKDYNQCMGGVDKLDFLITLYRTFIRSRKWTLRMFTHAIDMACANSWLQYKAKSALLKIPKRDVLDLLGFRAYVAEGLIKTNKMQEKKQGRPLSDRSSNPASSPRTPSNSRIRTEVRPIHEVRYDQIGHFPTFDNKSFASRCKNIPCKGQTRVTCIKCNVHLCLNKGKNCFLNYHVK